MDQKRETPEPEPHHGRNGHLAWFLWFLFILFVVYPLSVGPVVRYTFQRQPPPRALVVIYGPLETLVHSCRPLDNFFNWYLDHVWRARPSPAPISTPVITTNGVNPSAK